MKKQSPYLVLGTIMLGAVMRVPITAIPSILTDIAAGLGVSVSDLGILTSIPLLMFALCSSLAPKLAAKFGMEKLMAMVLIVMFVGSAMRIFNVSTLYLGTMLVGAAIAFINVLLPSLVAANFPHKIGLFTTIYVTMMGVTSTLASMVAVPIVTATSWQTFLLIISALVGLALFIWLPNVASNHRFERKGNNQGTSLWKNRGAIIFLIFGGLQSLLFYTEMTWLPTISQTVGLSKAEAGLLAGIFNIVAIPMSMVLPSIVSRLPREKRAYLMIGLSVLTLLGLGLMAVVPVQFGWWLLIHILLGVSVSALFPYMMLSFSLKTSNSQATARLSGMVQTGGYLIAAIGPFVLGYSYQLFGNWLPFIIALIVVTILMMWTIVLIEKEDIIL
ncbi:TPA: MFS transporter [Streptococcus suis]